MLDLIEPIIERNRAGFVRLDGKVPQKKRQMLVRQFMDDPECRMFLTTNAGSVGLNLQAADTVVNVDLPWNPAILEQRIGRAHRMGQKRHVQIFLLVTEETIEEEMLKTLSAKHDLALAALDIGSEVMMKSGVEELKRRLEVLLGSKPVDRVGQSETTQQARETLPKTTERQQEEIVQKGSEMVGALFQFLGALAGQTPQTTADAQASSPMEAAMPVIRQAMSEAVRIEADAEGKTKISLTMPERPVLENLLQSAAQLLSGFFEATRKE